jgi:hypothetical protein
MLFHLKAKIGGNRGALRIVDAMPESRWNSSQRCWYLDPNAMWGMVSFDLNEDQPRKFCILFTSSRGISILDTSTYSKEIVIVSQSTSQLRVRDLEELFGSSSLKWKDEMDIKDLNLTVKASTEEPNRQVVVRLGDFQMLKVWIGGNRSHIRVQDTDAKSTDVETQSDEEGADLTNEEW